MSSTKYFFRNPPDDLKNTALQADGSVDCSYIISFGIHSSLKSKNGQMYSIDTEQKLNNLVDILEQSASAISMPPIMDLKTELSKQILAQYAIVLDFVYTLRTQIMLCRKFLSGAGDPGVENIHSTWLAAKSLYLETKKLTAMLARHGNISPQEQKAVAEAFKATISKYLSEHTGTKEGIERAEKYLRPKILY